MARLTYDPQALRQQLAETLKDADPEQVDRTVAAIMGELENSAEADEKAA